MDEHRQRLENASNSWLLTTVAKLNQQSETLINELADTTEKSSRPCAATFSPKWAKPSASAWPSSPLHSERPRRRLRPRPPLIHLKDQK